MAVERPKLPPLWNSLSARLLVMTVAFVMVSEVLIFAPSIASFRLKYLEERIAAANIAVLALLATPVLFRTPRARELWEEPARANMTAELAALAAAQTGRDQPL